MLRAQARRASLSHPEPLHQVGRKASRHCTNLQYKVGDRVLLDVRVVNIGDSRKFTSYFRGPFRIAKIFDNRTVEIVDEKYAIQRVHVNRLKPLLETMLWRDEPCPEFSPDAGPKIGEGQERIEASNNLQNYSQEFFRPSFFILRLRPLPTPGKQKQDPLTNCHLRLTKTNPKPSPKWRRTNHSLALSLQVLNTP